MTVAWISFFPVEWLPDVPDEVRGLPRGHPATWQRVLLAELENMPSLRLHVVVLRKQFRRDLTFVRNGVTFHLLKSRGGLRAPTLFWYDTLRLRPVLQRIQPDVVQAWGTENGAAMVASRLPYPSLVTIQGLTTWLTRLFRPTCHERILDWLERVSLARSHLVTAESRFSTRYVQAHFPHTKVLRIDVVPAPLFHQIARQPKTRPLRLLFCGTLGVRKGGDVLLEALEHWRHEVDFELNVIGTAELNFVQGMAKRTSNEVWRRVHYRENLTSEEVAAELSHALLFVCPTRADTGPMSVKEAAVAGVPIVGSNVGGVPDYVFPGENGLLFPPGDWKELLASLRRALQHPLFKQGLVDQTRLMKLRERLSPRQMAEDFQQAYRQVLLEQNARPTV